MTAIVRCVTNMKYYDKYDNVDPCQYELSFLNIDIPAGLGCLDVGYAIAPSCRQDFIGRSREQERSYAPALICR